MTESYLSDFVHHRFSLTMLQRNLLEFRRFYVMVNHISLHWRLFFYCPGRFHRVRCNAPWDADIMCWTRDILTSKRTKEPGSVLTFLGIGLDSAKQLFSLPARKLDELLILSNAGHKEIHGSKAKFQSLLGSLQFAVRWVPVGSLFTRRMIRLLAPMLPQSEQTQKCFLFAKNLFSISCGG